MEVNSFITQLSNAVEVLLEFAPADVGTKIRSKLEHCTLEYIKCLQEEYEEASKSLAPYEDRDEVVSLSITTRHLKSMLEELQKQSKERVVYVSTSGVYEEE